MKNGIYIYLDEDDKKQAQVIVNGTPYLLTMTDDLEALEPGFYEQGTTKEATEETEGTEH